MAYQPPKQSGAGQLFDSLLIIVILFACLLVPFLYKKHAAEQAAAGAAQTQQKEPDATWESLKQTPVQQQQWEKLGKKPADAKPMIGAQFDFDADLRSWKLWLVIVMIVGYFIFVLRLSDREYRQVIDEKFGNTQ